MSDICTVVKVGIIELTRAAPPVPPVPSLTNETVSPIVYPSPASIRSNWLIVASDIDATLAAASAPPPPEIITSSPTR